MRRRTKKSVRVIAAAAGLGVVAGLRSMTAPAMLSWAVNQGSVSRYGGPAKLLQTKRAAGVMSVMAAGELIADKLPFIPNRTSAPSLAARVASGALVGGALCASKHKPVGWGIAAGALGALVGTYGGFHLRRRLSQRVPGGLVAVAEDAIAVGGGALLMKAAS